ncbi:MAG TPA: ankyrin repeat domain-containing protein [Caulobacteraceae bacterium]|jgi:ankyrin repeat protein
MVSKTRMLDLVRAWDSAEVDAALAGTPGLQDVRDPRGRSWLHVCCGVELSGARKAEDSVRTAEVLLDRGFDINAPAFTEGDWLATPLWYAIGRGHNLPLAAYLLRHGSNPNYCLFAASFANDLEAIRLLVAGGADVDDPSSGGSPFLGAIRWSQFVPAEQLLKLGADVNRVDRDGMTALHCMLKKGSDKAHFAMLIAHGARGDIPDKAGVTAAEIMRRKRDPDFQRMAEQLATST